MAYSRTLNHFTSMQELATLWASSTSYVVNQLVINDDKLYRCLIAHTSGGTFIADLQSAYWVEISASEAGVFNYIENSDAEVDTSGWSTYNDGATAAPIDGSGGVATITWSRSTVSPLRGDADFNITTPGGGSVQGQGVSYDFTIDNADQAKILTISFDYEVLSGTYASGDLAVYVIQDPAGTPVVLQPAGYQVEAATVGNKVREVATFQTASNVTSYRLCIHVASTNASAYSLALDNISVSPQQVVYGAPVTDWQTFTPTGSWTSNVTYTGKWRRVGDSMEIQSKVTCSGAPNAATLSFNLPSGFSIDTLKLSGIPSQEDSPLGVSQINDSGVTTIPSGLVVYNNTTSVFPTAINASATFASQTTFANVGIFNFGSGDSVSVSYRVPILGWSSSVVVSSSTDTRVVAASYKKTASQAVTGNVTDITFQSSVVDTHAAFNGTAFVAPVPGLYDIGGVIGVTTGSINVVAFVNGTARTIIGTTISGSNTALSGLITLNAGDSVTIRSESSITVFGQASGLTSVFSIKRLSGPSQIAASETVAASYWVSANQAITANVTTINYDTREFDSHGMVATGAGWVATIPISGTYLFTGSMVASSACNCVLYKNGVAYKYIGSQAAGASGSNSATVRLVAGDQISFRGNTSVTVTGAASLASNPAHIGILRVGN
jgi:hypothetical protein